MGIAGVYMMQMSKVVLFFVSAAFFASEFTPQATAEDSMSDSTEKDSKIAAQEEKIAALEEQIAALHGKDATAHPPASTTDLKDSADSKRFFSLTDSQKSWTLSTYSGGTDGQYGSTPSGCCPCDGLHNQPSGTTSGTYKASDGKNYCEMLCKTMPGCTKFMITNQWNLGQCNFYKGTAGPYTGTSGDRRRSSSRQKLYTIGSTAVPNNHWLVSPFSKPKIGNPPTKSFAVKSSAQLSTQDVKCYPVVPFRATSGAPEFNQCKSCEFTDRRIDQYGCATCPTGKLPSDPMSFKDGTVTCSAQRTGEIKTTCSNKYSQDDSAVTSSPGGTPSDVTMVPAAQLSCLNLGVTTSTLLVGYKALHTVVRVGCSFWKHTSCVGVWSTAGLKWITKCGSTKKSHWLFVDTCTERSASFDYTVPSTHGSSTCTGGTKNMCENCPHAGAGNTQYQLNKTNPEVLTTYDQLLKYAFDKDPKGLTRQFGIDFPSLGVSPAKDRLCTPTTINK